MSHVFISYARPDEPRAERVADALEAQGYHVWRDDQLPAHRPYAEVIEERLRSAKAVVVLWSKDSSKSQWVRSEADAARQLGTLVQANLDATMPPMPFNQIHCADLIDWDENSDTAGWRKLSASVQLLAGSALEKTEKTRPTGRSVSVCVLPFENMSGEAEQEYFSDGISEDITTDLSQVSALEVIARNTAFQFKCQSVDACEIAKKLGVTHLLEGSVRKAANRVRITAQLIDGATGGHVWADRYDRDLTDIFAIQDEISKAIVQALKVTLLPEEKKAIAQRGTASVEAYNLYLMARQYWLTGNHGDRRREERVERLCRRATEIDPEYAQAWALMGLAQYNLRLTYGASDEGGVGAASRALELDPNIAEAHCVLAWSHAQEGRDAEADKEIAIALELNPASWEVQKEAARLCMLRGNIPGATKHFENAVELAENDYHSWGMLKSCYIALGDKEGAKRAAVMMIAQAEKAVERDPSNGAALGIGAGGLAVLGQKDRAKEWIERALLIDPDNYTMRYNLACVLILHLKDYEGALKLLERNFAEISGTHIRFAETDPDLDAIRDDPRFQQMLAAGKKRLGLVSEPRH